MALKIIQNHLTKNDCYKSGRRISSIGIQIHTIGTGQNAAMSLINYWNQPGISCCVHYLCDAETKNLAYQILPENYRSWADAGFGNNNLLTIEGMESDHMKYTGGASYTITDEAKFKADIRRSYRNMVQLCAKICTDRKWNPMTKLSNGLHLISSHNEGRLKGVSSAHIDPTHIWDRLGYSMDSFRRDVADTMGSKLPTGSPAASSGFTDEQDFINKIGKLAAQDMKTSGILASVTVAQAILESGYGTTELAQNANNFFGMKCLLSGNTWPSVWDGKSKYAKKTEEQDANGNTYHIKADFRKYPDILTSLNDHSCYLNNAMNGNILRYKGLKGESSYQKAIQIIKNGGYATDMKYVQKICSLIERWDLTSFDRKSSGAAILLPESDNTYFRVRRKWTDEKSQLGAFTDLENAKKCVDQNNGYKVFAEDGQVLYRGTKSPTSSPFKVKVTIPSLNIRTGPGLDHTVTAVCPIGTFTILETCPSDGYTWGRLKSGKGWIALEYTKRLS